MKEQSCCQKEIPENLEKRGLFSGLIYGIIPHTFCIAFILFSVIGATTAASLLKPFLLNHYFLYILIAISFIFATISAAVYLKRNESLSVKGLKSKWRYLSILYGTTILVNFLFFLVIFPALTNMDFNHIKATANNENIVFGSLALEVDIPCSGHAPLIAGELKKMEGIGPVEFRFPNIFYVNYDSSETSPEKIISLEVFETYQAHIIK